MGRKVKIMIDSGANGNFMSPEYASRHQIPTRDKEKPYSLALADGTPIAHGKVRTETQSVTLDIEDHQEQIVLDVTPIKFDIILGISWLERHDPVVHWRKRILEFPNCDCGNETATPETSFTKAVWVRPDYAVLATTDGCPPEYQEFEPLFKEELDMKALPEHQLWDHEIPLEPGTKPVCRPIYSLSEKELKVLREYLDENQKKGFIRPSTSPAGYPIIFVPKKDGKLRLCVDYRQLNSITIKNRYALPLISELHDRIRGAKWFTTLDLRGAYNLVRMKHGEEWKTAFRTRYGHYEYMVMPFGLTNAPASMQALVNDVLREFLDEFCVVYLDDILIYSEDKEQHIGHVKKVLSALQEKHLLVKLEKCEFHKQSVRFLGYILTINGIQMDESKVKAVQDWPTPTTVKELQSFLGFANFYRRFIEGYSRITAPLTDLTRKDLTNCSRQGHQAFTWGTEAESSFQELKGKFTTAPILATFDPERQIVLETDASDYAISMCISQPDNEGRLRPIAFYSRKMIPAELNYEIHDKELLAIVAAFGEWRVYLEGSKYPVEVYTDHKNLLYFTSTKVLTRRQVRWSELLSGYNFRISYRKGNDNAKADALSRRADHAQDVRSAPQAVLRLKSDNTLIYNHATIAATFTISDQDQERRITHAYAKDRLAREIRKTPEKYTSFLRQDSGLILYKGLIYIANQARDAIVRQCHEEMPHGHQGIEKTLERISRTYYFPGMNKAVRQHIANCDTCWKTKHSRHKPYGELSSPKAPEGAWKSIALDFVTKLPLSKDPMTKVQYDSVLVITDRLTKYAYFVNYLESSNAEDLAYTFLRIVFANHGMPAEIISDRDKLFTSKFWKSLMDQLGTKHKLSTAYHPQTDGQTERINQVLEQYLRCYVNYRQNNWVVLLPLAQFAYNSSPASTGISPFYANYGYEPVAFRQSLNIEVLAQKSSTDVSLLTNLHKELTRDIEFIATRSSMYYDSKRLGGPNLKEGDPVYLLRKNIKTKRPSSKLDYTKLGPYPIQKVLGKVTYRLKLPDNMRIHPVFHISLLEPAPKNARQTKTQLSDENQDDVYEVEKILDQQDIDGKTYYLIKWSGYNTSENTWEPETNLSPETLEAYHRRNPRGRQTKQPTAVRRGQARTQHWLAAVELPDPIPEAVELHEQSWPPWPCAKPRSCGSGSQPPSTPFAPGPGPPDARSPDAPPPPTTCCNPLQRNSRHKAFPCVCTRHT
jgi:transposase InsO family protein